MKLLWLDTETTGLTKRHGVIQISGIVIINNKKLGEFDFTCAPFPGDLIEDQALSVNKRSRSEIMTFDDPKKVFKEIIEIMGAYVDKYDKKDKFILAGHNVQFDKMMLQSMADKCGFKYLFSYLDYHMLDTSQIAMICRILGLPMPESNKLEELCKYFDIPLKAHNSMEDITATVKLCEKLIEKLVGGKK